MYVTRFVGVYCSLNGCYVHCICCGGFVVMVRICFGYRWLAGMQYLIQACLYVLLYGRTQLVCMNRCGVSTCLHNLLYVFGSMYMCMGVIWYK